MLTRPPAVLEFFPTFLQCVEGAEPVQLLDFLRQFGYQFAHFESSQDTLLSNEQILALVEKSQLVDLRATAA